MGAGLSGEEAGPGGRGGAGRRTAGPAGSDWALRGRGGGGTGGAPPPGGRDWKGRKPAGAEWGSRAGCRGDRDRGGAWSEGAGRGGFLGLRADLAAPVRVARGTSPRTARGIEARGGCGPCGTGKPRPPLALRAGWAPGPEVGAAPPPGQALRPARPPRGSRRPRHVLVRSGPHGTLRLPAALVGGLGRPWQVVVQGKAWAPRDTGPRGRVRVHRHPRGLRAGCVPSSGSACLGPGQTCTESLALWCWALDHGVQIASVSSLAPRAVCLGCCWQRKKSDNCLLFSSKVTF